MTVPLPHLTPLTRPYWEALDAGQLTFQKCEECDHAWLPAREACPACLSTKWDRVNSKGNARVVSWVVYHTAYAEHLKAHIPYNVAVVELEEGPRMLTSVIDCDHGELRIGTDVQLRITSEHGFSLPYFAPASGEKP